MRRFFQIPRVPPSTTVLLSSQCRNIRPFATMGHAFGNPQGLTILDECRQLRLDLVALREQLAVLTSYVNTLPANSDGYLETRSRFIGCFRRDVFKDSSRRNSIMNRNKLVHSAHARTDYQLYAERMRDDPEIFEILYGLSWERVEVFGKSEVLLLVNSIYD